MQLLLEELHDDGVTLIFKEDEIPLKKKKRDAAEFEIASQVENDEITTTSTITLTSSAQSETQANEEALEEFFEMQQDISNAQNNPVGLIYLFIKTQIL